MPPIHFKLTQQDGPTRRISFQTFPTWDILASRAHTLFGIPVAHLGVSYLDSDNDEITVSSNEELEDYYQSCYKEGEVIKLSVLDLNANREAFKSFAHISPPRRNTFGQETFELIEHIHPFPGLVGITGIAPVFESDLETPHAFVDIVSDAGSDTPPSREDAQSMVTPTVADDDRSTNVPSRIDKGKGRATSVDDVSTASVLAEEPAYKYPIHVSDVSHVKAEDILSAQNPAPDGGQDHASGSQVDEPTPMAHPISLEPEKPSPTIGDPVQGNGNPPNPPPPRPTLSQDIASFLSCLSSFVEAHPELQERLRRIYENSTTGAYWQSDQADDASRPEAEDAKLIISSLSTIIRSVIPTSGRTLEVRNATPSQSEEKDKEVLKVTTEPIEVNDHMHVNHDSLHHRDNSLHSVASVPPPKVQQLVPPMLTTTLSQPDEGITLNPHDLSRAQLESAKELYKREKERYRQEREQRRKEREELKAKKAGAAATPMTGPQNPPGPPKPFSAEFWSAPTGMSSFSAPPPPQRQTDPKAQLGSKERKAETTTISRATARVAKRLSEMGFPETRYPDLTTKIRDQLTKNRIINNDVEDNIVTNLLEELLVKSPKAGPSDSSRRKHFSDSWY